MWLRTKHSVEGFLGYILTGQSHLRCVYLLLPQPENAAPSPEAALESHTFTSLCLHEETKVPRMLAPCSAAQKREEAEED